MSCLTCTVRKKDVLLFSIDRRLQKQFFIKYIYLFLPNFTDCIIFHDNEYKMAERALSHMLLKLIIDRVL
jgi:hypothetical protein